MSLVRSNLTLNPNHTAQVLGAFGPLGNFGLCLWIGRRIRIGKRAEHKSSQGVFDIHGQNEHGRDHE